MKPTSDSLTGTRGSSIFSKKEWEELARDLRLSPRLLQLVQGIFDDKTEQRIADDLSIAVHTVHSYRVRLYQKLSVCSHVELVLYVFERHLERHRLPKSRRSAGESKRAAKQRDRP